MVFECVRIICNSKKNEFKRVYKLKGERKKMFRNEEACEDEVIMFERPNEAECSVFVCKKTNTCVVHVFTYICVFSQLTPGR